MGSVLKGVRRWGLAGGACAALTATGGARAAQTITVVNEAHVDSGELHHAERALIRQSRQLQHWWPTPVIRFGAGGWRLYLVKRPGMGIHWTKAGVPFAVVSIGDGAPFEGPMWTAELSHELLEMLADPAPDVMIGSEPLEVCDPVNLRSYRLDGAAVSDFVLPAWFHRGSRGPWDFLRSLRGPLRGDEY